MTAIENSRAEFEEFVSSSPFEYSTDRYPDSAAFPGTYKSLRVDLAWSAWCESRKEVVNLLEANAELHGDYLVAVKERDGLAAKLALVIECGDSCCDEYCKDEWELAANAGTDKAIAKLKADAVREFIAEINRVNQIEAGNERSMG